MIHLSFPIEELEYFLLILTRITCFVMVAPFFSIGNVPSRVKIGMGFFISFLIYYATMPHTYPVYTTFLEMATLILKEASVGLLLGFATDMCSRIVMFSGHVVDMEMGLAMANQFDPITKENTTVTGMLYHNMLMLLLIISGMYRYFVSALTETFQLIPVGGAVFHLDSLLQTMISFLGDFMLLGMRVALPVFCTIMLLNAVLGILAKVAPQMNMFAVGIQLKVFTGLAILFLTIGLLPRVSDLIFEQMKRVMVSFVGGMM